MSSSYQLKALELYPHLSFEAWASPEFLIDHSDSAEKREEEGSDDGDGHSFALNVLLAENTDSQRDLLNHM